MTKPITCPKCGARAHWESEDQTFEYTTPGWIGRIMRPRQYQQTAAPTWGFTTQVIPTQQQQEPRSALPQVEVQPGESRTHTQYRPKSVGDIMAHFVYSAVFGGAVGGIVIGLDGDVRQIVGWASGAFAFSLLVTAFPVVLIGGANVVSVLENLTRKDINGDGRIGNIAIDMTADVPTGPQSTRKTKVTIPLSQIRAWRQFCQGVTAGRCNFSGNAAEAHGVDRDLFDDIVEEWASEDPELALVDPASVGPRLTPRLVNEGKEVIAWHGTTPLPELVTVLERLTGTDRQQTDRRE